MSADGSALPRCNQAEFYKSASSSRVKCPAEYIIDPVNDYKILQNFQLRQQDDYHSAVQIKPQHVTLSLRVNEAYDMDFWYEQAVDYPVDLYYLMDLSKSMEDDKEKLSALGDHLASTMRNITSNFRLGFGSFVDKVVMPFVSTVPRKLVEPCTGCAAPYGYKHHMDLSTNTEAFSGQVKQAQVSGNLDAPEGGFDAIMQAIVCKTIGWRETARRLLVFSTDAGFHYAGDGKLGGIVTPNDGECHLDSKGVYTYSSIQDYPSVSQINHKVKENAINLIFAVTEEQIDVYKLLAGSVEGSSAGTLSADSSNVVQLVKAQYEAITSSIEVKHNATGSVRVTFFSNCVGDGPMRKTNKCSGLRVGTRVMFTAKIEVVRCPDDPREWKQTFQIYPVGINEGVLVNLEMICQCDCEKPGFPGYEENSPKCNFKGTYKCGICECAPDAFGRFCECDAKNMNLNGDLEAGCRPDNTTTELCHHRGDCICGKCECMKREMEDEIIDGKYCECDNFSCDRHNGELCSGTEHGICECGKCKCYSDWNVPGYTACECQASNDTCITPRGEHIHKLCSGHGECECGECRCEETEEGQYSGKYCEDCPTCPDKCMQFKACVQCMQFKSGELMDNGEPIIDEATGIPKCMQCPFIRIDPDLPKPYNISYLEEVDKVDEYDEELYPHCTFIDDDDCRFYFVYGYHNETGKLQVGVQKTKECPRVVDIMGIVLGVIGAIVAIGLVLILMWKVFTTIHDRREFARFEKERMMAKWDTGENPIFKQATSTFKNPTYAGK
jgi:protocadherin alpha